MCVCHFKQFPKPQRIALSSLGCSLYHSLIHPFTNDVCHLLYATRVCPYLRDAFTEHTRTHTQFTVKFNVTLRTVFDNKHLCVYQIISHYDDTEARIIWGNGVGVAHRKAFCFNEFSENWSIHTHSLLENGVEYFNGKAFGIRRNYYCAMVYAFDGGNPRKVQTKCVSFHPVSLSQSALWKRKINATDFDVACTVAILSKKILPDRHAPHPAALTHLSSFHSLWWSHAHGKLLSPSSVPRHCALLTSFDFFQRFGLIKWWDWFVRNATTHRHRHSMAAPVSSQQFLESQIN